MPTSSALIVKIFGKTEFGKGSVSFLGGKGAHLAELHNMGLPVPPFVNLTTDCYKSFEAADDQEVLAEKFAKSVHQTLWLNNVRVGETDLVSVRSGSPVSMPGMMDTILNVGLSLDTQEHWEEKFDGVWFWDSYSRLLIQLADALGFTNLPSHEATKGFRNSQIVTGMLVKAGVDVDILTSPKGALQVAITAVFKSWNTERAVYYRNLHDIDHEMGTACNIQQMVFGNVDDQSGTGVMFTRNPSNGENQVTGEFLVQAQGEDVVDGSITPMSLKDLKKSTLPSHIGDELFEIAEDLESHFGDMQDVEFTIEQGKLWILQTRKANRTSEAAFRIAVEMIEDEELSIQDVLDDGRLSSLDWFSVKGRSIKSAPKPTYIGLAAGSGIAQGRAVFTSQEAVDATDPVILVRPETIPDDIAGMYNAEGIVTFEGGMTSHAAVVARGMNKPCIVGVTEMAGKIMVGDMITIDSANGLIWVNSEIEINDRGGSVYADKYIMLVQNHWDVLVGRNRYMSNSVLTISQMSDVEFESMIEQVTKTGDWLDNVYLVTSAVPSYFEDDTPLNKFADLAASDTLYPMTAKRVDKIKALKSDALYFEDAPIVASISQMENSSTWVRLDIEAFEGFLGSKSKEIISQMENWECSQKVLDWVQDEEQFALGVFE